MKVYVLMSALVAFTIHFSLDATAAGVRTACKTDIKTHCAGVQKGKGRIKHCLDEHTAELTPECKASMQDAQAACDPDRQKFCADVPEGEGRIMECLKSHKSELSEACQAITK